MGQWKRRTPTRKSRLPADWERLRRVVLERDNYHCQWREEPCFNRATDVDHIETGDDHSLSNLQSLCGPHHRTKTSRDARAQQLAIKAKGRLPEEKQPGIIDGPPQPTQYRGF